MNVLIITAALAVGFIFGILAETIIDAEQIRKLNATINRLKFEKETLIENKTEIIEIVDNRTKEDSVDYFKPF